MRKYFYYTVLLMVTLLPSVLYVGCGSKSPTNPTLAAPTYTHTPGPLTSTSTVTKTETSTLTRTASPTVTTTPTVTMTLTISNTPTATTTTMASSTFTETPTNTASFTVTPTVTLTVTSTPTTGASWQVVGTAGFSGGGVFTTSLAVDSGVPYVAYEANYNSDRPTVMTYSSSAWSTLGGGPVVAGVAGMESLSVYSGTPYVAFYNTSATELQVYSYNSGWSQVGGNFAAAGANYPSLYVYNGTPYLAFSDISANSYKATVVEYTSGAWATVGSADFSAGQIYFPSICVSNAANGSIPAGTPYVAYEDVANGYDVNVMAYISGAWATVGNAELSGGEGNNPSLFLDASGIPYVAYEDVNNSLKATVMKCSGCGAGTGTWTAVGTKGFSAGSAVDTSLYIYGGTPYVGFSDGNLGGRATVMEYTGAGTSGWVTLGNAGFSSTGAGAGVAATSLSVNGGIPYLAYEDTNNANDATLMEYH